MMRYLRLDFVKVQLPPQPAGVRWPAAGGCASGAIVAGAEAAHSGVIRYQHPRKISSVLIRNTVGPNANRTTPRTCLVIEGVNRRKPEFS